MKNRDVILKIASKDLALEESYPALRALVDMNSDQFVQQTISRLSNKLRSL